MHRTAKLLALFLVLPTLWLLTLGLTLRCIASRESLPQKRVCRPLRLKPPLVGLYETRLTGEAPPSQHF